MPRAFASLDQFLAFMATRPAAVEAAIGRGLERGAKIVEAEAKRELGTYQTTNIGPFAPWPELAEPTQKARTRQGFAPNDPLLREGVLRDAIEHTVRGHEAAVGVPSRTVQHGYDKRPVDIGDVAIWQELGTAKIPPRSFLGVAGFRRSERVARTIANGFTNALAGNPPRATGRENDE